MRSRGPGRKRNCRMQRYAERSGGSWFRSWSWSVPAAVRLPIGSREAVNSASSPCHKGGSPYGGNRSVLTASAASVEPGKAGRLSAWRRVSEGQDEDRNGRDAPGAAVNQQGQERPHDRASPGWRSTNELLKVIEFGRMTTTCGPRYDLRFLYCFTALQISTLRVCQWAINLTVWRLAISVSLAAEDC